MKNSRRLKAWKAGLKQKRAEGGVGKLDGVALAVFFEFGKGVVGEDRRAVNEELWFVVLKLRK